MMETDVPKAGGRETMLPVGAAGWSLREIAAYRLAADSGQLGEKSCWNCLFRKVSLGFIHCRKHVTFAACEEWNPFRHYECWLQGFYPLCAGEGELKKMLRWKIWAVDETGKRVELLGDLEGMVGQALEEGERMGKEWEKRNGVMCEVAFERIAEPNKKG